MASATAQCRGMLRAVPVRRGGAGASGRRAGYPVMPSCRAQASLACKWQSGPSRHIVLSGMNACTSLLCWRRTLIIHELKLLGPHGLCHLLHCLKVGQDIARHVCTAHKETAKSGLAGQARRVGRRRHDTARIRIVAACWQAPDTAHQTSTAPACCLRRSGLGSLRRRRTGRRVAVDQRVTCGAALPRKAHSL